MTTNKNHKNHNNDVKNLWSVFHSIMAVFYSIMVFSVIFHSSLIMIVMETFLIFSFSSPNSLRMKHIKNTKSITHTVLSKQKTTANKRQYLYKSYFLPTVFHNIIIMQMHLISFIVSKISVIFLNFRLLNFLFVWNGPLVQDNVRCDCHFDYFWVYHNICVLCVCMFIKWFCIFCVWFISCLLCCWCLYQPSKKHWKHEITSTRHFVAAMFTHKKKRKHSTIKLWYGQKWWIIFVWYPKDESKTFV